MLPTEKSKITMLTKNSDALIAVGLVGILVLMIVPVPSMLLDIFLSFSIAFAIAIMLVAVYTLQPLEFSVFPSMLLLTTLYRLSLNVASTRLIILNGSQGPSAAGDVIMAFGQFVVGGNYLVGILIFLILVIINFVVITKGAGRIAEVAARFTLDAMPGKQMSIDADLNAGLISDEEARERRLRISREADFYGAMDGASKFVRGDAIAGIIITFINIIGGLLVGSLQQGMGLVEAATTYTILTVGDGLVTQIPALIVSTAAGLVVTRAGSGDNLGREMSKQLFHRPKAIVMTSMILFFFALIPGLPALPFIILAIIAGIAGYIAKNIKEAQKVEAESIQAIEEEQEAPEPVKAVNPYDILELEVGYGLIPLLDTDKKGGLLDRIRSLRRQLALELGIIVPPIHIRDNLQLKPNTYSILLKGVACSGGDLMINHYLAMDAGSVMGQIEGIQTTEPAFGLPAVWVNEDEKENAQLLGYTVVDPSTVVATHLIEEIRNNAHELIGRQELQNMLDQVAKTHPKVVEEVTPNLLTIGVVLNVLQNLLKEKVSIRDIHTILETMADHGATTANPEQLTEFVRQRLSRAITRQYQEANGEINVITIDDDIEDVITRSIRQTNEGSVLALDPGVAKQILSNIGAAVENISAPQQPIILCSSTVRSTMKKLSKLLNPNLVTLSYDEISQNCTVKSIANVRL